MPELILLNSISLKSINFGRHCSYQVKNVTDPSVAKRQQQQTQQQHQKKSFKFHWKMVHITERIYEMGIFGLGLLFDIYGLDVSKCLSTIHLNDFIRAY